MDRLYLQPIQGDFLQGDIFADVPSIIVRPGPLRVARWARNIPAKVGQPERALWGIHTDDTPPKDGMRLSMELEGEEVLVHGYRQMAMLLTNDCEVENDSRARTVAMIRSANELAPEHSELLFSGSIDESFYSRFPLEAQLEEPVMERSFVDFMRLTTVHPQVLEECRRVASLPDELRNSLAIRFKEFLFRKDA